MRILESCRIWWINQWKWSLFHKHKILSFATKLQYTDVQKLKFSSVREKYFNDLCTKWIVMSGFAPATQKIPPSKLMDKKLLHPNDQMKLNTKIS